MPPQFPQLRMPRQPKFVTPKSPFPWDVAAAAAEMEHDLYEALVKEPAEAAGVQAPPELPGLAAINSMLFAPLQTLFGGLMQGGLGGGETKRGTIEERREETRTPTGGARRGSL